MNTQTLFSPFLLDYVPYGKIFWRTAVHESGHVLVAHYTKHARSIVKVRFDLQNDFGMIKQL